MCLELTENALMQNVESTIEAMLALRNMGVHLSIDDFGTGYSSLSYLKRFPVEALKIDRSFIDGLGREHEDTSIVEAIVTPRARARAHGGRRGPRDRRRSSRRCA